MGRLGGRISCISPCSGADETNKRWRQFDCSLTEITVFWNARAFIRTLLGLSRRDWFCRQGAGCKQSSMCNISRCLSVNLQLSGSRCIFLTHGSVSTRLPARSSYFSARCKPNISTLWHNHLGAFGSPDKVAVDPKKSCQKQNALSRRHSTLLSALGHYMYSDALSWHTLFCIYLDRWAELWCICFSFCHSMFLWCPNKETLVRLLPLIGVSFFIVVLVGFVLLSKNLIYCWYRILILQVSFRLISRDRSRHMIISEFLSLFRSVTQ